MPNNKLSDKNLDLIFKNIENKEYLTTASNLGFKGAFIPEILINDDSEKMMRIPPIDAIGDWDMYSMQNGNSNWTKKE